MIMERRIHDESGRKDHIEIASHLQRLMNISREEALKRTKYITFTQGQPYYDRRRTI